MMNYWDRIKGMKWHIRRNPIEPIGLKRDYEREKFEKDVRESFLAIADEFDELKKYICDQQIQINELRRIIEKGR